MTGRSVNPIPLATRATGHTLAGIRRPARRAFNRAATRRGYVKVSSGQAGLDPEFAPVLAACGEFTMTSPERMYALFKAVEYVCRADVPGDVVECGVWRGGSAMVAAMGLQRAGDEEKNISLYDTFRGMTEPTSIDGSDAMTKWRRQQRESHNDWCFASLEEVQRNLLGTGFPAVRLRLVEGSVEDTIPRDAPEMISVLRLDTDWYESTRHELVHLYPRLAVGGVLIVDDYGHWSGQRRAVDEYFAEEPILLNRVDHSGYIGVKPDRHGQAPRAGTEGEQTDPTWLS